MPIRRIRVYIAGPYTNGDVADNVANAIDAADTILKAGHHPYVPHLTHFWHLLHRGPYHQWINLAIIWLRQCEALVRLPGESTVADNEVSEARKLGICVFFTVKEFLRQANMMEV